MGSKSGIYFANMLKKSEKLRILNIDENELGPIGVKHLLEGLRNNLVLKELSLS